MLNGGVKPSWHISGLDKGLSLPVVLDIVGNQYLLPSVGGAMLDQVHTPHSER
jgi:hypothetical protein